MLVGRMWHASDQPPRLLRIGWGRVRRAGATFGGLRRVSAALGGALACGIILGLLAGPTTPGAAPRRVVVLPAASVPAGDDRAPAASGAGVAALQATVPPPPPAPADTSSTTQSSSSSDEAQSGGSSEPATSSSTSKKTKKTPATAKATAKPAAAKRPPIKHVIVVALAEKGFAEAFGPRSQAPYLAKELRAKGLLLRHYYATAHGGLPDLVALLSGQGSNPALATGCPELTPFAAAGKPAHDGQVRGKGCVFPASVNTLPAQLEAKKLGWRAYVEGADPPAGQAPGPCAPPPAPAAGTPAQERNPLAYFAGIARAKDCTAHVTGLGALAADLAGAGPAPALALVLPDTCHAGREGACAAGEPDGLARADAWLREWIPQILAAPGYADDTMLVITFDEARGTGPQADLTSCCGQTRAINEPASVDPQAPAEGGGRVGALVISPKVKAAAVSNVAYNHLSLLRTVELAFGLPPLGLSAHAGVTAFGEDVFAGGG